MPRADGPRPVMEKVSGFKASCPCHRVHWLPRLEVQSYPQLRAEPRALVVEQVVLTVEPTVAGCPHQHPSHQQHRPYRFCLHPCSLSVRPKPVWRW
jgi:hypothetical protein